MPTTTAPPAGLQADRLDEEGWPILQPTVLTIHRTSPDDVKIRQVIISLDGERIATLLYGQSVSREILPGPHKLRANNTLVWRTVEFDAAPGARIQYDCINRASRSMYMILFLFGVAPLYVLLEPRSS